MAFQKLRDIGVVARNFKCFGEVAQGFYEFRPFNIIIGKNNSGKSALADLLGCLCASRRNYTLDEYSHLGNRTPEIIYRRTLTEADWPQINRIHHGNWKCHNAREVKSLLIGKYLGENGKHPSERVLISNNENFHEPVTSSELINRPNGMQELKVHLNSLENFSKLHFIRMLAERDIQREEDNITNSNLSVEENGSGVTKLIANYLHNSVKNHRIVTETLLEALNRIYLGDAQFDTILARKVQGAWEIFLEEHDKGLIPLSQSGSSLKTVLLVLANLLIVLREKKIAPSTCIVCFEELENNLHPGLLRRLLVYLEEYQRQQKCMFILTTHSNVMIDWFANKSSAQILHVTHDGKTAQVNRSISFQHHTQILDDIEARASDLLQANGIIWVEGPSERIYLNHWIDMWSEGQLREGAHYQIVTYGGALLKHYSGETPARVEHMISLLKVNRNCALIADSDQQGRETSNRVPPRNLKPAVTRVEQELKDVPNAMFWVTDGTEIENYIPMALWKKLLEADSMKTIGAYEKVFKRAAIKKFETDKVKLSYLASEFEDIALWKNHLDLDLRMNELCQLIRKWNHI